MSYGAGWAVIVPEYAGVVKYDIVSQAYEMAVEGGQVPSASRSGQAFCCYSAGVGGPLIILVDGEYRILDEELEWEWRKWPCVNYDGTKLAWKGKVEGHEIGIWIYNMPSSEYLYIGTGSYPAWHTTTDKIVYKHESGDSGSGLVEYSYSTAEYDTIYSFDDNVGSRYMSYSPQGGELVVGVVALQDEQEGVFVLDIQSSEMRRINNHYPLGISWGDRGIVYSSGCEDVDDDGCGVLWFIDVVTWEYWQLTDRLQFVFQ